MASSARRPRVLKSTPAAAASPGSTPRPTVSRLSRPRDSRSIVASCLASTTGWWYGTTSTAVPSSSVLVAAATYARHVSGSATARSGGSGT